VLSRAEVSAEFQELARSRGYPEIIQRAVGALFPFACHVVLTRRPVGVASPEPSYWVSGRVDARIEQFQDIHFLVNGLCDAAYSTLPVWGHHPLRASGIYIWIKLALEELERKDVTALDLIRDWSTAILWLSKDKYSKETELTSVAIPILPFCTFLTKKAIRHIPPKTLLPAVTLYGLQENLFHEALHQQLSASLLFRDLVADQDGVWPTVAIPWRNKEWPIDRAVHAAWIYKNLIRFRNRALQWGLEGGEIVRDVLANSQMSACEAYVHLRRELLGHRYLFTSFGRDIVDQLD
jgi:hypothetical protein